MIFNETNFVDHSIFKYEKTKFLKKSNYKSREMLKIILVKSERSLLILAYIYIISTRSMKIHTYVYMSARLVANCISLFKTFYILNKGIFSL